MALTGKFLLPIRASLTAMSSSCSTTPFCGKFEPLKAWMRGLEPVLHNRSSRFRFELNLQRRFLKNFSLSGSKFCRASIIGVAAECGLIYLSPLIAYSMDGHDILMDDDNVNSCGASDLEEDTRAFWAFARKFWLPVIFFVTILMNWDRPITLVIKVLLFLLSTKPSRFSVYLFVEELCQQSMLQKPYLYKFKEGLLVICSLLVIDWSWTHNLRFLPRILPNANRLFECIWFSHSLYANKVEVSDYRLLCLAKVELGDQKFTLVGILGGWWALSASQGSFSVFWNRALKNY